LAPRLAPCPCGKATLVSFDIERNAEILLQREPDDI